VPHAQTKLQFGYTADQWKKVFHPHTRATRARVEPLPEEAEWLIEALISRGVLQHHQRPDSLIVNVYELGDCIKPHIDDPNYERPFCTVSLSSSVQMGLGSKISVRAQGVYDCPFELTLPARSVLVLDGNGANLAKHCIPSVPQYRVSWTLRRMPLWVREQLETQRNSDAVCKDNGGDSNEEKPTMEVLPPCLSSVWVTKLPRKTSKLQVAELFSPFGSLCEVLLTPTPM